MTNGELFRQARKLCQLSLLEVSNLTGYTVFYLSDIERNEKQARKHVAADLWEFYRFNEKPNRFEGSHKGVADLRKEWYRWYNQPNEIKPETAREA